REYPERVVEVSSNRARRALSERLDRWGEVELLDEFPILDRRLAIVEGSETALEIAADTGSAAYGPLCAQVPGMGGQGAADDCRHGQRRREAAMPSVPRLQGPRGHFTHIA